MKTNDEIERLKRLAAGLMDEELPKANVLVAGVTGAGKSTLLNAVLRRDLANTGIGRPITSKINCWEVDDCPVRIYDTMGFELEDAQVEDTVKAIKSVIAEKNNNKDVFDRVHAIWYCIQSSGGRFQDTESNFIKELYNLGVPFIIVLTKCINKHQDDELEDKVKNTLREKAINDTPIVKVLAQEWEINEDISVPSKGLEELVKITSEKLPDYIIASFATAQKISKLQKREVAEGYILRKCDELNAPKNLAARIPIVNIFCTNDRMEKMFKSIGDIYNTSLSSAEIKDIYENTIGKWKGKLGHLINPFGHFAFKEADEFYNQFIKDAEGFASETQRDIKDYIWAAKLIIWSGYSWIFTIEKYWDELFEAGREKRERLIEQMKDTLNNYMKKSTKP